MHDLEYGSRGYVLSELLAYAYRNVESHTSSSFRARTGYMKAVLLHFGQITFAGRFRTRMTGSERVASSNNRAPSFPRCTELAAAVISWQVHSLPSCSKVLSGSSRLARRAVSTSSRLPEHISMCPVPVILAQTRRCLTPRPLAKPSLTSQWKYMTTLRIIVLLGPRELAHASTLVR